MTVEKIPWPITRFYNSFVCKYLDNFYNEIAEEVSKNNIGGAIFDAGTGPGWLPIKIAQLMPTATIVGMDVSRDMIRIAQKNAEQASVNRARFVVGSIYRTGFNDSTFDLVVSTGLVHHLEKPAQAFDELYRILKPQREAWMYDGRRDASREEMRITIGDFHGSGLTLPLWIVERVWPYMHVGYKTEEYTRGKVASALEESRFEDYQIVITNGFIKIVMRKG
jgi:ubiquinone/menaquinone biosynthesis C-methylase UbiE